jgi:glycosyltransferase involved in cell wall biosynthesis
MTPRTVAVLYGHRLDVGGVETHLLSLMSRCDPARWGWRIFGEASAAFADRARSAGGSVHPWPIRGVLDVRAVLALDATLREAPPDLLHVHHPRALLAARVVGAHLGIPVVYTVHLPQRAADVGGKNGSGARGWLYPRAERLLLRVAPPARVVHVSARARAAGGRPDDPRVVLVRNGIDLSRRGDVSRRAPLRAAFGTPADAVVVLAVARLVEQKGIDVLLDAVARLDPPPCLWVAGEGPLRSDLELRAAALPPGSVRFLGSRDDVPDLLQACDVFVLPSRRETTPMALLEAMAAGRACIATAVGDCPEIFADGAGRTVPPGDAPALARRLDEFARDAELRAAAGAAAASRVLRFGDTAMAERTAETYEAVLAEHAALRAPGAPRGAHPMR